MIWDMKHLNDGLMLNMIEDRSVHINKHADELIYKHIDEHIDKHIDEHIDEHVDKHID